MSKQREPYYTETMPQCCGHVTTVFNLPPGVYARSSRCAEYAIEPCDRCGRQMCGQHSIKLYFMTPEPENALRTDDEAIYLCDDCDSWVLAFVLSNVPGAEQYLRELVAREHARLVEKEGE